MLMRQTFRPFWRPFFQCTQTNKIDLHHCIRDSLFTVCPQIMPLVSRSTKDDTYMKLTNIYDAAPSLRPEDIVQKHPVGHTAGPRKMTLIDVTIIPPHKYNESTYTHSQITSTYITYSEAICFYYLCMMYKCYISCLYLLFIIK